MDKLKSLFKGKTALIGSAAAIALIGGYYYYNKGNQNTNRGKHNHFDKSFNTPNIPLLHSVAKLRDEMLKQGSVKYELLVILSEKATYQGKLNVEFELVDKQTADLYLDFQGYSIRELIVNGTVIPDEVIQFSDHKVYLPRYYLKSKTLNKVSLKFENTFVTNSSGFHRYVDPLDSEVYLYTHLEPFNCNRWFPCFDQPSIRAPLSLRVITKQQRWIAVGNENIIESATIGDARACQYIINANVKDLVQNMEIEEDGNLFIFDTTPPISTYIYALAAGPYTSISNEREYKVPMKIYCRQSKRALAEPEERFRTIMIAINYFEEYFQTPFPFKKYDMVFVPEFRINGMENVGIVIMRDTFMRPAEEKTFFEFQQWYKVAVHELSHMWFGDLVTMRWWNDLWLKESFAEYSTMVCLTECPEFNYVKCPQQIGLHFLWEALNDDCKRTTHPIQVVVNHTNDANNMYDKICYRKGACFLKQIDHFVGRDIMREGIKLYFQEHSFKVTTLQDFVNCLTLALQKNRKQIALQDWVDSWLMKSGANELTARYEQKENQKWSIHIHQAYPRNGDRLYHEQIIDIPKPSQDGECLEL